MTDDLIPIGFIRAAHGLRGGVLVHAWSGRADSLMAYGDLQDATGEQHYTLSVHDTKDRDFICRVKGVENRNEAEALRGLKLFLPASKLPATDEDEFYHRDLIGLRVENADGVALGIVRDVVELVHHDALLIEFNNDGKRQTELLLFTKQNVPFVSVKEGRITIDMPHGLLDEPQRDTKA